MADTAPTTNSFFQINHIWTEVSSTITAIGIIAVALAPLLSSGPPTSTSGWVLEAVAAVTAVMKALGNS